MTSVGWEVNYAQFRIYPRQVYKRLSSFSAEYDTFYDLDSGDSLERIDDALFQQFRKEFIRTGKVSLPAIDYRVNFSDRLGCCWNIAFSQTINNCIIVEAHWDTISTLDHSWDDLVRFGESHEFLFVFEGDSTFSKIYQKVVR